MLRDEGRLLLDDPVDNYLPWFEVNHRSRTAGRSPSSSF